MAYLVLASLLAVVLLPTALRPPNQPPPGSGALSPDEPPDDEVIVSELARGRSATAGAGPVQPGVGELAGARSDGPLRGISARRGRCFGNPPRQTESLYSAPCAAAFVGDNGGSTSKGVTSTEINIGIAWDGGYDGPLDEQSTAQAERQLKTWLDYFNRRYELYGRRLRFIMVRVGLTTDPATAKSKVAEVDTRWPLFAWQGAAATPPAWEEAIRRKIVTYDDAGHDQESWFSANHPYAYGFLMDVEKAFALGGEVMCKQFVGRPPAFNERMDASFDYTKPRRFGFIGYEDGWRVDSDKQFAAELAKCGERIVEVVKGNLYDNQSGAAAAMTKMRAAGVTTVITYIDPVHIALLSYEAFNTGYWPEWWRTTPQEDNAFAQLFNQQQWRHAMGTFTYEIPRPPGHSDCSVAFRSENPDLAVGRCDVYRAVQQYANGIQLAGPRLNPDTLFVGMTRMPCRPPDPPWSIGGCYGDGDHTYEDYTTLGWWDPDAIAPDNGNRGAHRHMFSGRRFTLGEIPDEAPWFREGITTPPDPVQYD